MKITKKLKFAALAALAVALLVQTTITQAGNKGRPVAPSNPFVTLLEGIFEPITDVPNLGLSQDINNGTVLKIAIFNIDSGIPSPTDKVAGTFYVQFPVGDLCAYDFPKGKILAKFTFVDDVTIDFQEFPDGSWIGNFTEELVILEATGIYQSFTGGHIHMVDRLEYSASDDNLIEHCFCHYSRKNGNIARRKQRLKHGANLVGDELHESRIAMAVPSEELLAVNDAVPQEVCRDFRRHP